MLAIKPRQVRSRREWNQLLKSWDYGSASQLEHARRYTVSFPSDYAGWIALADALWSLARYMEAKAALRTAERLVPPKSRYRAWEQWGHMYREMNDLRRAEKWYRKALRAHRSARGHILLGATLARQGRRKQAERQHRAAIKAGTPGEPIDEAHVNLALMRRASEDYSDAAKHLREALKIDSSNEDARAVLRDVTRAMRLAGKSPQPPPRGGGKRSTLAR